MSYETRLFEQPCTLPSVLKSAPNYSASCAARVWFLPCPQQEVIGGRLQLLDEQTNTLGSIPGPQLS